jgi:hypothetical protein
MYTFQAGPRLGGAARLMPIYTTHGSSFEAVQLKNSTQGSIRQAKGECMKQFRSPARSVTPLWSNANHEVVENPTAAPCLRQTHLHLIFFPAPPNGGILAADWLIHHWFSWL